MLDMVVTFVFDTKRSSVLLIRKKKPLWQAGKINGIGGKIEPGESAQHAAQRELEEESGLVVPFEDLKEFCIVSGPGWRVHFFKAFVGVLQFQQRTSEEVVVREVEKLGLDQDIIWNLRWLIPLALDDDLVIPMTAVDTTYYVNGRKANIWGP